MIVEIITIGDELLAGSRIDTNSAFIAGRLESIGLEVRYITSIGDSMDVMVEAISHALRRSDIILATGGLGPTDDDVTKNAICKVFKRKLIFHEDILKSLEKRFADRGIKMPAINQNQALLPQGARFLANKTGSALGIIIDEHGKFFCAMPGVPREMKVMVDEGLLPLLQETYGAPVIVRHRLRTTGIMESALAEKIRPDLNFPDGVSLAYLPSYRGVDLYVKGRGQVAEETRAYVDKVVEVIKKHATPWIYTESDMNLEEIVGLLLTDKKKTLATAESCTGGLLGGTVTAVAGSSAYYLGGVVAYANEVKIKTLGVPAETIEKHGAVSSETARAMAVGVCQLTGSDIGVSVTGIAGPDGGTPEKPVGTIFIGLAHNGQTQAERYSFGNDREINRERTVTAALEMVRRSLI